MVLDNTNPDQLARPGAPSRAGTSRLVGEWLKEIRAAAGLTQAQLAQVTGIAQPTISKLEKGAGEGSPALLTLERYVAGCGRELSLEARPDQPNDDSAPPKLTNPLRL